jgi:hypothetical protein
VRAEFTQEGECFLIRVDVLYKIVISLSLLFSSSCLFVCVFFLEKGCGVWWLAGWADWLVGASGEAPGIWGFRVDLILFLDVVAPFF